MGFDQNTSAQGYVCLVAQTLSSCLGCRVVYGVFGTTAFAEVDKSPGAWTMSSSVPEPSSAVLLATALATCLALLVPRTKMAAPRSR